MKKRIETEERSAGKWLVLTTGVVAIATYTYDTFTNAHGPSILFGILVYVLCWFACHENKLAYVCYWIYSAGVIAMALLGIWMIIRIERSYNARLDLYIIAIVRGILHVVTLICFMRERAHAKRK